jgi:hypothetical protein
LLGGGGVAGTGRYAAALYFGTESLSAE